MALNLSKVNLLLVLAFMLWHGAKAQSGCTRALIGLSPCLNYVSGNSSTPSSSCCSQLTSVVQSQPVCLCSLLNGGGSALGITMNKTLALALPNACNVQTPPVSQCNSANGPTAAATPESSPANSPADSPADSSDNTPDVPDTPSGSENPSGSGSGSKRVPNTDGFSANGSSMKTSSNLAGVLLFLASCAFYAA